MTNSKTMDFIEPTFKTGKVSDMKNKVSDDLLSKVTTSRILWHLVKRHKFTIVSAWAVVITISWAFPPFWDILGSLFR